MVGLWWGLRAGAPHGDDNQKVFDIDHAIFVFITCTRPLDTTCFDDLLQILDGGLLLIMHGQ